MSKLSGEVAEMLKKYEEMLDLAKNGVLYTYSDAQISIAAIAIVGQLINERKKEIDSLGVNQ